MPRFGSITSPASYRPSYSGGTYRSAGIKRETPLVTSYTSRYSTLPSKETVRELSPAAKKAAAPKYGPTTNDNNVKSTRFASTGNLSSTKSKAVDPTPSRLGRPAIIVSRTQSRNPSPLSSVSRSRSRDPSPAEPPKDRFVSSSGYTLPSSYNKLYSKSPSYGNKLSLRGSSARGISPSPALSYMTASDTSVRIMKRQTEKEERSLKSSAERSPAKELRSKETDATEVDLLVPNKPIEMVEVTVVTRGTSPTLCPTTNYSRSRRIDVAKTIEKTIMRPRKKAQCEDKEVQSDRLDDTSKYCRFNSARAPAPWSPYLESKLGYGRYSSSSVSPSKTPSRESPENGEKSSSKSRESSVTSKSSSASSRISASKTASSPTKSSKSKSKSPPIALTKQKSPSTKCLPPPAPKSESPSKTTASSTPNGSSCSTKWANKDFRKSALNVGPTDRPRKMRHSSVETDSEENRSDDAQRKSMSPMQQQQRFERSPSVSSEMSGSSGHNTTNTNEIAKVFAKLKLSGVGVAANAMNKEKTKATITTPHANESCAKNASKSPSPMTKIFTNSSSFVVGTEQRPHAYDANRNEDDVISICENIERIAIEGALELTNPTTKTTLINRNNNNNFTNHIVDETTTNNNIINNSNWLLNSTDDQATTSTSGSNSTCQLFINSDDSNALNMKNKLRHIDSGELPWWMTADEDDDETIADDLTLNQTESETQPSAESNDDTATTNWPCPSDDPNRIAANQRPTSMYPVTRIGSGERAWWMDNDGNDQDENRNRTDTANNREPSAEPDSSSANYTFKIKRIESGEKAWWMTNVVPDTENTENIDFWSEINEKHEQERKSYTKNRKERNFYETNVPQRDFDCAVNDGNEGPPGQRASPEGLEDFTSNRRGLSPYATADGIVGESFGKNSANKLFISRHQNIDDLLGGTGHTMNAMRLERFDNSAPLEEILPTQVRIHDGTAHTSYMQYVGDDRSER